VMNSRRLIPAPRVQDKTSYQRKSCFGKRLVRCAANVREGVKRCIKLEAAYPVFSQGGNSKVSGKLRPPAQCKLGPLRNLLRSLDLMRSCIVSPSR
jgi:hypothetical protein